MTAPARPLATLDETLALLRAHDVAPVADGPVPGGDRAPVMDLLAQCQAQDARNAAQNSVRTLHHFACTGGTLIASCLAALPNVALLNEIDPLSKRHMPRAASWFLPSDILIDLHGAPRRLPDRLFSHTFQAGILALRQEVRRLGQLLVLRDHSHSQFCSDGVDPDARQTLREILLEVAPVLSLVTVRQPIASFLSLREHQWVHFRPATFDEYCRRYMLFLDRHADLPVIRYEDFVVEPEATLQRMCDLLDLNYASDFGAVRGLFHLSGGSGRASDRIGPRPPREVPADLEVELQNSAHHVALCERLGYPL